MIDSPLIYSAIRHVKICHCLEPSAFIRCHLSWCIFVPAAWPTICTRVLNIPLHLYQTPPAIAGYYDCNFDTSKYSLPSTMAAAFPRQGALYLSIYSRLRASEKPSWWKSMAYRHSRVSCFIHLTSIPRREGQSNLEKGQHPPFRTNEKCSARNGI